MKYKIILFLLVLISLPLIYVVNKSKPQYQGERILSILDGEAKVYCDEYGIPYIYADDKRDLHRALGYVMAQDRLFQMDLLRRIGNGKLSEVLGPTTVKHDVLLRILRLKSSIEKTWYENLNNFDPEMVQTFNDFLSGVHVFIDEGNLPLEFILLNYTSEKFTIPDVLSVSGYMALSFAEGLISDILFTDLLNHFSEERVKELGLRHNHDNYFIQKESETNKTSLTPLLKNLNSFHSFARDYLGLFHGSNSWVVSGSKTKSGAPILANDPHIAFSNPSVWYEVHLKAPGYEIYGHFIPLMPFPAMGHDDNKAWAVTMSEMDDLDLYEEKVSEDKLQVMYKNEWYPMEIEESVIKIKGKADKNLKVYITPHGPLLDGTEFGIEGKHLSLKWSYHHPQNFVATTFYRLGKIKDLSKLNWALSQGAAPGLNISWVDKSGNIAWKVHGKVLKRKGFRGTTVLEGWSGKYEYDGYYTIDQNPGKINPKKGMIITANYYPEWQPLDKYDGYWQPGERIERIHELLQKPIKWDMKEMMRVQTDQFLLSAKSLLDVILPILRYIEGDFEKPAYEVLEKWVGKFDVTSVGSTIFHQTIYEIGQLSIKSHLGPERFKSLNKAADYWHFFKWFMHQREHEFWDNKKTDKKETRDEIITQAFKNAVTKLLKKFGSSVKDWTWGKLHTIEYEHPLGKVKPLNYIFNIGPFPAGGGFFQVDNMTSARYSDEFKVTLGPSTRRLVDMANPRNSFGILPTGNSGNLLSPYYKDQVKLFLDGEYRKQKMDLKDITADEYKLLILKGNEK